MQSLKKSIKFLVIGAILAALLLLSYNHVSNSKKTPQSEEPVTTSVVRELLLRNLDRDYPPTPKEVVKYYSDITQCYYNEVYTDEELELLAKKSMELMDEELKANNPWEKYVVDLKSEIAGKKEQDCKIFSYNTSASTDVEFYTKDGRDMASLYCTYTIRLGTSMGNTTELYILRKDLKGHWKILGWMTEEEEGN